MSAWWFLSPVHDEARLRPGRSHGIGIPAYFSGGERMRRRTARSLAGDQRAHHGGVELAAAVAQELGERVFLRHRLAIGAVADHRDVGVGGVHDAALDSDLVAAEPGRVARAVDPLVVLQD